jgi:hypothetical protein
VVVVVFARMADAILFRQLMANTITVHSPPRQFQ